jgi:hypothetical protein
MKNKRKNTKQNVAKMLQGKLNEKYKAKCCKQNVAKMLQGKLNEK